MKKEKKKLEFYADKDITFDAYEGEILGILGPNGAGKTTLLRMIAGIMTPTKGIIKIDNLNYEIITVPDAWKDNFSPAAYLQGKIDAPIDTP